MEGQSLSPPPANLGTNPAQEEATLPLTRKRTRDSQSSKSSTKPPSKKEYYKRKQQETSKYRSAKLQFEEEGVDVGNWFLYKSLKLTFPQPGNEPDEVMKVGSEITLFNVGKKIVAGISVPKNGVLLSIWVLNSENQNIENIESFSIHELVSINTSQANDELWNKFVSYRTKLWSEMRAKYRKTSQLTKAPGNEKTEFQASHGNLQSLQNSILKLEKQVSDLTSRVNELQKEKEELLGKSKLLEGECSVLRILFRKDYEMR